MAPLACIKKLFDEKKRRETATATPIPSSSSSVPPPPPPPPPPSAPRRNAPISFAVSSGPRTLGLVPAFSNPSALPVRAPPTTNAVPAPPTSSAATVVPGMKALWAQQRAAAKDATTSPPQPTPTSTSTSSPPSAPSTTPFRLASAWTSNAVANEDDPMEWDEMDCSDDYPFVGQVGSNQAAWVYERVILPGMIDAGLSLLPSPPYAFPFVTEPTIVATYSSSIFPTSYRTIGASTLYTNFSFF